MMIASNITYLKAPSLALHSLPPYDTRHGLTESLRKLNRPQQSLNLFSFSQPSELHAKKLRSAPNESQKAHGILKRDWCKKHQEKVFGCVVVVVQIDGSTSLEQHVGSAYESARSHLRSSVNTRVVVAITTMLGSDELSFPGATVDDFVTQLRLKCGIDQRSLIVLYRNGEDALSLSRLWSLMFECCQKYHRDEVARIKKMKNEVMKSPGGEILLSRYRFKIAWHSLVLQDLKMMRHNLEKAYAVIRSQVPNSIDLRITATICHWSMVASNCNHLISSAVSESTLIEHLDAASTAFQNHLWWCLQPLDLMRDHDPNATAIMSHCYISEWYQLLATKIISVVECHRVPIDKLPSSCFPSVFFHAASSSLLLVRQLSDLIKPDPIETLPITFFGEECKLMYLHQISRVVSASLISERMYDLLVLGMRYCNQVQRPRLFLQMQSMAAEHLYFKGDFKEAFNSLSAVLGESRLMDFVGIACSLHKLMVQTCRRFLKIVGDGDAKTVILAKMIKSLLYLSGSVEATPHTQQVILAEASKRYHDFSPDGAFHEITFIHGDRNQIIDCMPCFNEPFYEAGARNGRCTLLFRTIAQGDFKVRNVEVTFRYVNRKSTTVKRICFEEAVAFSSKLPLSFSVPISFTCDGLIECEKAVAFVVLCESENVVVPLAIQFENEKIYPRFDSHVFDSSIDLLQLHYRSSDPLRCLRPVARIVKPVPKASLEAVQAEHAIEGEFYAVEFVIRSVGDELRLLKLIIPFLESSMEVFAEESIEGELHRVCESEFLPFIPEGYDAVVFTVRNTIAAGGTVRQKLLFHCQKGGKFELPVRLHFATESCAGLVVSNLLVIHVCHPFFAIHTLCSSDMWCSRSFSNPVVACPSARIARYLESSVLREIGDTERGQEQCGRLKKIDSSFGSFLENFQMTNMMYSVERIQVSPNALEGQQDLHVEQGAVVFIMSKLSNSLYVPLTIHKVEIEAPCSHTLIACPMNTLFPCSIGVDEAFTFCCSARCEGIGDRSFGLMRVQISRSEDKVFSFELPLPTVCVIPRRIQAIQEYPDVVSVGEQFILHIRILNRDRTPHHIELGIPTCPSEMIVSGRSMWSFVVGPGEERTTKLRLTPTAAGEALLPPLTLLCEGETVINAEEKRITVLPSTQSGFVFAALSQVESILLSDPGDTDPN